MAKSFDRPRDCFGLSSLFILNPTLSSRLASGIDYGSTPDAAAVQFFFAGQKSKSELAVLVDYLRIIPGIAPPILAIIFDILPIFFIIVCIWKNLFSIVFNSVTLTPPPVQECLSTA